jgi:hypothetical protein
VCGECGGEFEFGARLRWSREGAGGGGNGAVGLGPGWGGRRRKMGWFENFELKRVGVGGLAR